MDTPRSPKLAAGASGLARTAAERLLVAMLRGDEPRASQPRAPAPGMLRAGVNDWDANQSVREEPDGSLFGEAIALARAHGVAPLLHEQLQRGGLAWVPEEARRGLRALRLAELAREVKREKLLQAALRALGGARAEPVTVLLLKGAASARTLYPSGELRPRGDLDLLVAPADRARSLEALARAGFVQHAKTRGTREDEAGWHERTLIHPEHGEAGAPEQLDLHFALAQPERHRLDARRLFAESAPLPHQPDAAAEVTPGLALRVLRPEAAALVCAWSIALHELAVPLIGLADLARLLARAEPPRLAGLAGEVHLRRALYVSLRLLARLGPPAFPSKIFAAALSRVAPCAPFALAGAPVEPARLALLLEALPLSTPSRRALDAAAGGYDLARAPLSRVRQLWRKALFIDRPQDAARFALRHARSRWTRGS